MNVKSKCHLYVVGPIAVGKTTFINKIARQENIQIAKNRNHEKSDWIIQDLDYSVIVEIKERPSLGQLINNQLAEEILANSIVIIVISNVRNSDIILNEYLNRLPRECLVIIVYNRLKEKEFENTDLNKLKSTNQNIREIVGYDLYNDELLDFSYLLKNIILNKFTNRLNYARKIIEENFITKSKELDLGNCSLTSLYEVEELFENTHIEKLILSNEWATYKNASWHKVNSINKLGKNTLGTLHPKINKLKKLKCLIAGGDWNDGKSWWNRWRIVNLNTLQGLTELEYLNVSNNRINAVPSFSRLKKIKVLHLNNNYISKVKIRSNSISIEEIYLSNNQLTTISFLKYLLIVKTIDIHGNRIKSLDSIVNQIERLNITNSKWE